MKRRGREESERSKNALEFIFIFFRQSYIFLRLRDFKVYFIKLTDKESISVSLNQIKCLLLLLIRLGGWYLWIVWHKMEANGVDVDQQSSSINKLPNEILLKIFKLLQYREMLMSYRTCKRWRQLTSGFFEKLTTKSKLVLNLLIWNAIYYSLHFLNISFSSCYRRKEKLILDQKWTLLL